MFKTIACSTFFGIMVWILCMGCRHGPTEPREEVSFKLTFRYGEIQGHTLLERQPREGSGESQNTLSKKLNIQSYDLARVMVIDLSAYLTWQDFTQTQDWDDYIAVRDAWTGHRDSWDEWKGFIGDFFPIVTDQVLRIEGNFATGTVTGVIGLNRILVALIEFTEAGGDVIRYLGEGDALGVSGEISEVEIGVQQRGDWQAIQQPGY
jgi:hypothetical protein